MEACHSGGRYKARTKDLHAAVKSIVDDEIVCHADSMGLHGMALAIMIIADFGVVKVRDSAHLTHFVKGGLAREEIKGRKGRRTRSRSNDIGKGRLLFPMYF
jgi:hypothetical protein